jgi:hypothetical protein
MRRRAGCRSHGQHLGLDFGIGARRVGGSRCDALAGPLNQRSRGLVRKVAAQALIFQDTFDHLLLTLVLAHNIPWLGLYR